MTAMMNDLIGDSFESLPATVTAKDGCAPVLTVTVNRQAVLTIARRLHDGTCLDGAGCELRDFHALDAYESEVESMLAVLVQAATGGDSPEITTCRGASDHRWFRGQWWCKKCASAVKFRAGEGWVHVLGDVLV